MKPDEIQAIFSPFPGGDDIAFVMLDADADTIEYDELMAMVRDMPPCPVGYKGNGKFDCDKIAGWMMMFLNVLNARSDASPRSRVWGSLGGNIPLDGDNTQSGWHDMIWYVDRSKTLHLLGAQDRNVVPAGDMRSVLEIDTVLVGR